MGKKHEVFNKKIILLGDQTTGKTTILKNIKNGTNYVTEQLMGNKFELKAKSKSKKYTRITLWDGIVSGYRTDYRPIAYKDTSLIVIIYSIDSYKSYQNVENKWLPEVRNFAPGVPIMLIGNKMDTRKNNDCQKLVRFEDGCQLAEDIEAAGFLECSAFDDNCLDTLVQTLLASVAVNDIKNKKECVLM